MRGRLISAMVKITERKTKQDWAIFLEEIADQYKDAEKITLVMDNLNTHEPGSFYEAFLPEKAKALWDRFEFVYTPKHGSWLNMAEIDLNVLTGQCLNRRIERHWSREKRSIGMAEVQKQQKRQGEMAVYHQRCSDKIITPLSDT